MGILSKTCNYGILAAIYIASRNDQKFVPIREISEKLNISFHFLTKILQILTQKKIMTSYRGPNGGVSFARNPSSITVLDIIEALGGADYFECCILGIPGCGIDKPCPLHDKWGGIREELRETFKDETLADLASRIQSFRLKISA